MSVGLFLMNVLLCLILCNGVWGYKKKDLLVSNGQFLSLGMCVFRNRRELYSCLLSSFGGIQEEKS